MPPRIFSGVHAAMLRRPVLIAVLGFCIFSLPLLSAQEAQAQGRRVEFTLLVDVPGDDIDQEIRARHHHEVVQIAADRIETRLDAIGVKNFRVLVDDSRNIQVTAYGRDLSAAAIKSAVIPPGRLELRPVISDEDLWLDLAGDLPDTVELRTEPGSFQVNRFFLFSRHISALRHFLSRLSLGNNDVGIFPHEDGWRTLTLGPSIATHHDIHSAEIHHTPSAVPFITLEATTEAASRARASAASENIRHLAVILDGEIVALTRLTDRQAHAQFTLNCPDFLRSTASRQHWAMQVAGRLATPIPVTLVELQE